MTMHTLPPPVPSNNALRLRLHLLLVATIVRLLLFCPVSQKKTQCKKDDSVPSKERAGDVLPQLTFAESKLARRRRRETIDRRRLKKRLFVDT